MELFRGGGGGGGDGHHGKGQSRPGQSDSGIMVEPSEKGSLEAPERFCSRAFKYLSPLGLVGPLN